MKNRKHCQDYTSLGEKLDAQRRAEDEHDRKIDREITSVFLPVSIIGLAALLAHFFL